MTLLLFFTHAALCLVTLGMSTSAVLRLAPFAVVGVGGNGTTITDLIDLIVNEIR